MLITPSTELEKQYVSDRLSEFNQQHVPNVQSPSSIAIELVAKDDRGKVIGGIAAILYNWHVLFIDVLWVDPSHQGKGCGSRLVQGAEAQAKALGCYLIHLDTFDFQAKDFYLKNGYEIFGTLNECPRGHVRYYLKKDI